MCGGRKLATLLARYDVIALTSSAVGRSPPMRELSLRMRSVSRSSRFCAHERRSRASVRGEAGARLG